MSEIVLPENLSIKIANDAVRIAQWLAPKRTGAGAKGLFPIAHEGQFGIGIAKWAYYMYYQDMGVKPFVMSSLEGLTIPMNIGGHTIFRVAKNVGGHQIEKRDPKTGRVLAGNKPIKWRFPGLAPKNFIEQGMEQSLNLHMNDIMAFAFEQVVAKSVTKGFK